VTRSFGVHRRLSMHLPDDSDDDATFFAFMEWALILGACVLAPLAMIAVCLKYGHAIGHAGLGLFLRTSNRRSMPIHGTAATANVSPARKPTLTVLHGDADHAAASCDSNGLNGCGSRSEPFVASIVTEPARKAA
jgi:hypothetical protein